MKVCIVIPFYNHAGAIAHVVDSLKPLELPCFIVDDGSDAPAQQVLAQIALRESWVKLLRLPENGGKGAAVMAGCDAALAAGFTHALQIDADGQHDAADAARLLDQARQHPAAMVSGAAVFDVRSSRLSTRADLRDLAAASAGAPHGLRYGDHGATPLERRTRHRHTDTRHLSTRWHLALQDAGRQRVHQPHAYPALFWNADPAAGADWPAARAP
jgi:glycosyltransferase involved in cell wall biosynthesis